MKPAYDLVVIGAGLANLLFLYHAKGSLQDKKIAVVDPNPFKHPTIHISYWSEKPSYLDQFALASWDTISVGSGGPVAIHPYTLRLVRLDTILNFVRSELEGTPITWIQNVAQATESKGSYLEVLTTNATFATQYVLDSAINSKPVFNPRGFVNGYGKIYKYTRAAFDESTAVFFSELSDGGLCYVLPLSSKHALIESVYFGNTPAVPSPLALDSYVTETFGKGWSISHTEKGSIPLGFCADSVHPRHVLMGTKRGLVKASAGYGAYKIATTSQALADTYISGLGIEPRKRRTPQELLIDGYFLKMLKDQKSITNLLLPTMKKYNPQAWFKLIDETMSSWEYAKFMNAMLPTIIMNQL